jgi:hypothetical protein
LERWTIQDWKGGREEGGTVMGCREPSGEGKEEKFHARAPED